MSDGILDRFQAREAELQAEVAKLKVARDYWNERANKYETLWLLGLDDVADLRASKRYWSGTACGLAIVDLIVGIAILWGAFFR